MVFYKVNGYHTFRFSFNWPTLQELGQVTREMIWGIAAAGYTGWTVDTLDVSKLDNNTLPALNDYCININKMVT